MSDGISGQFDKIEGKVERLIEVCRSLEATNSELEGRIKDLEQELRSKIEAENQYSEQKDLVREKIDHLLSKLDSFSASESP